MIILFIGQQHSYVTNGIPPSEFPNVGRLVFNNGNYQSTDDLTTFINDDNAPTKCLFITQSPYSAGILQQAAKSMYSIIPYTGNIWWGKILVSRSGKSYWQGKIW